MQDDGQLVQRIPSGPPEHLGHHSRKFCLLLSGQVVNNAARIRVEQSTPALHRDLMTVALGSEFFFLLHSAVSLCRPQARLTSGN